MKKKLSLLPKLFTWFVGAFVIIPFCFMKGINDLIWLIILTIFYIVCFISIHSKVSTMIDHGIVIISIYLLLYVYYQIGQYLFNTMGECKILNVLEFYQLYSFGGILSVKLFPTEINLLIFSIFFDILQSITGSLFHCARSLLTKKERKL